MKLIRYLMLGPLLALMVACSGPSEPGAVDVLSSGPCTNDRDCLIRMADNYLRALVAHDPQQVPLASDLRFVENIERKQVGQGLWQTASGLPDSFRIYVPDPVSRQIGFLGLMYEQGQPILLALRLQVEGDRILAAEHVIARNLREAGLANLSTPRPGLLEEIPVAERMPRDELLRIGYSYYDALNRNDGSLTPFADDCLRHENGLQTSTNTLPENPTTMQILGSMGCAAQLDTGAMAYIDAIDNRRVHIADPVTGLVFGLSHFRHAMENKTLQITGVPGVTTHEVAFDPFDLPAAHVYKIRNGMMHEIEAMGFQAPYNSPTGWEGGTYFPNP